MLVDVAALDGVGEAPDQLALAGELRARRALAVGGRQPRSSVARARCRSALDRGLAGVEHLGASAVRKPSTSPSTSAARWRGGRCWSATMNESSIDSLAS
jgi:hypothetical protein